MIPSYESEILRRDVVKTSFSLSLKALGDIQYLAEKQSRTAGALLDFICGEMGRTPQRGPEGKNFLSLVLESTKDMSPDDFARKSYSVSSKSLSVLKRLKQITGVSRDVLLDSGIRTYRRLVDYTHPVAVDELLKLDTLMDEISNPMTFLEKHGIFIHDFYHSMSSDPHEQVYDSFMTYFDEFAQAVKTQVKLLRNAKSGQ